MRQKSTADLLTAGTTALEALSGPASGGSYQPIDAESAATQGKINKVPVLLGFNRDELWPFQHGLYPLSVEKYQQLLKDRYKEGAAEVNRLYPSDSYPHLEYAIGAMAGDSFMICPILRDAHSLARSTKVSVYEFADRTAPPFKSLGVPLPRPAGYQPGAFHTAELQYLYNYQSAEGPLNFEQRQLGDLMIQMWIAFNRRPSIWPSFQQEKSTVVRFGAESLTQMSTTVEDEHHCNFWNPPATAASPAPTK